MPSHMYSPQEPITWFRRFKGHIVEIGVAMVSLFAGLIVQAGALQPELLVFSPLYMLPILVVHVLGGAMIAGAAFVLIGLLLARTDLSKEINTEQIGWILLAGGWWAYAFSSFWFSDGAILSITTAVTVGCASAGRAWVLREIEKETRQRLRDSGQEV